MPTLENLGNIGEFVGALAVVVSLLYLAAQIRQNSRLIRTSTFYAGAQWNLAALTITAQSPQTAMVFSKGMADPSQLSEEERTQFNTIMHLIFAGFAQQYLNDRGGDIPEGRWADQARIARWYLSTPGMRHWWRGAKALLNPEFVAYAEANLMGPNAAAFYEGESVKPSSGEAGG